ncbi:RNA cap guanine-N2 methyltransferase [Flagellimonas pacifica]|uniref:RNA cap guanine-N2 methyltransferase n=1 Tax=Flagellimonas pacifica TaxID=1247520 RepID=A0A285MQY2_9FLAO|nr:RNA cap guanine-N2 methyltransferase [Allomuricauda parva]
MNKLILNTGVQHFIKNNWNTDIVSVLFKKPHFEGISQKELSEQLEAKKKCKDKLPTWFHTEEIYYPNKLNIEQTSSEQTAAYKSKIVSGKLLLDATGGLGVDTFYFSKKMDQVSHCEIDSKLSHIAQHNFEVLGQNNIVCIDTDGIETLKASRQKYDWVYIDPSRRSNVKGKVFLFKDCIPNLPEHLPAIFEKSSNILVKTSPLLDISQGLKELDFVKEIHVVAINNDVKELLFVLEHGFDDDVKIKTINLVQNREDVFNFQLKSEQRSFPTFGEPEKYLYEPNSAILKSGGFKSVANAFGLKKLHQHSHLYTSTNLIEFPGRRFEISQILPYSKKALKDLSVNKANITTRNFPISVAELRKKHKIKDGGGIYLFFTTDLNDKLLVLICKKV